MKINCCKYYFTNIFQLQRDKMFHITNCNRSKLVANIFLAYILLQMVLGCCKQFK